MSEHHGHDHEHGHQHGHQHDHTGSHDARRQEFVSKVVDRIASDPQFREQVKADPRGALEAAGLSDEYDQLQAAGSAGQGGPKGLW
jgi:hypothetical protein